MIIPVADLVPLFGGTPLTVERATASTPNMYGEAVETRSNVSITIAVHQATRKQLERAGLDHGHDWRAFYANVPLRCGPDDIAPDIVQYQGQRWELHNAADYQDLGGISMALGRRIE